MRQTQILRYLSEQKGDAVTGNNLQAFTKSALPKVLNRQEIPEDLRALYLKIARIQQKGHEQVVNQVSRKLLEMAGFDDPGYGFELQYKPLNF